MVCVLLPPPGGSITTKKLSVVEKHQRKREEGGFRIATLAFGMDFKCTLSVIANSKSSKVDAGRQFPPAKPLESRFLSLSYLSRPYLSWLSCVMWYWNVHGKSNANVSLDCMRRGIYYFALSDATKICLLVWRESLEDENESIVKKSFIKKCFAFG